MRILFLEHEQLYDDLLPSGLRQIGCEVKMVTEVLDGALEKAVAEFRPDFALIMGWSEFLSQERRAVIREVCASQGIPLIYWATEDPCWQEYWSLTVVNSTRPDLVLTMCAECVPRYEMLGFRAACLPLGFNHELFHPVPPRPEYDCDIAVVATFYTWEYEKLNRKRSLNDLVRPLLGRGYRMRIWGRNWNEAAQFGFELPEGVWHGFLPHREAPAVYNSAKIVLGVQNEFDYATNITMRTCEALGSGAFLLASRTKAIERLFWHRRHLVMSGSPEETVALVEHYLNHPEERAAIAANGLAEVRARHTYAHRARELLRLYGRLVRPKLGGCR